nr:MAG TPA: hypothetical protein [Caudoviricetes sp.]
MADIPHKKHRIAYNDRSSLRNHHPRCVHLMNLNKSPHHNKSR